MKTVTVFDGPFGSQISVCVEPVREPYEHERGKDVLVVRDGNNIVRINAAEMRNLAAHLKDLADDIDHKAELLAKELAR